MTESKFDRATPPRGPILFAKLTPPLVRERAQSLHELTLLPYQREILQRLAGDARMNQVWKELLRSRRPRTGHHKEFLHPAIGSAGKPCLSEEIQNAALAELFVFAFDVSRKQMMASKPSEIKDAEQRLIRNAQALDTVAHDLESASMLGEFGINDPDSIEVAAHDVMRLRGIAGFLRNNAANLRKPTHPLMVSRHRVDQLVRGVQISIARKVQELFAKRLDRTVAVITSVALGRKASNRTARSALSPRKRA